MLERGEIFITDINSSMLDIARRRMIDAGLIKNINYCLVNAEQLPFADNYFDCITIGFGLRNVTHIDKALAEMRRVIVPGGRVLILEFSKPQSDFFKKYMMCILLMYCLCWESMWPRMKTVIVIWRNLFECIRIRRP